MEVQHLTWPYHALLAWRSNRCRNSVSYSTSDQHKEATSARIERDLKDTRILMSCLTESFGDEAKILGTTIVD